MSLAAARTAAKRPRSEAFDYASPLTGGAVGGSNAPIDLVDGDDDDDEDVTISSLKAVSGTTAAGPAGVEGEDEVEFAGERSWEERDAELRAQAVELDADDTPQRLSTSASSAPSLALPPVVLYEDGEDNDGGGGNGDVTAKSASTPVAAATAAPASTAQAPSLLDAKIRMERPPPGFRPRLSFERVWERTAAGPNECEPPAGATIHVDSAREAWYESMGGWPATAAPALASDAGELDRDGYASFMYAVEKDVAAGAWPLGPPDGYVAVANRGGAGASGAAGGGAASSRGRRGSCRPRLPPAAVEAMARSRCRRRR